MRKIIKKRYYFIQKSSSHDGYAILFTVILISIISLISIGLSSSTYKQLVLSSLASSSQTSFYMADMATECALYIETKMNVDSSFSPFSCGINKNGNDSFLLTMDYFIQDALGEKYSFVPGNSMEDSVDPCFRIEVIKTNTAEGVDTTIRSSGYNICNKSHPKTVERMIELNY